MVRVWNSPRIADRLAARPARSALDGQGHAGVGSLPVDQPPAPQRTSTARQSLSTSPLVTTTTLGGQPDVHSLQVPVALGQAAFADRVRDRRMRRRMRALGGGAETAKTLCFPGSSWLGG